MLKKLLLVPALLLSINAFAHDEQTACLEQCEETKAVVENCVADDIENSVKSCSDIKSAFCIESLLKAEPIQKVYSALDEAQKTRFETMMNELSLIVEEAAKKTEAVMENNKDIRDVWNAKTNGTTRFVLSAGFEND